MFTLAKGKVKTVITGVILFLFYVNPIAMVKAEVDSALMKPIHVQFTAQDCFLKKVMDTILAGIPVVYTFSIKVCQPRQLWFDWEISTLTLVRTIQYDTLKNEYRVTLDSKNTTTVILTDFSEVKKKIENVNETILVSSDLFKKNDLYYLKYHLDIKAESASGLPLPLDYLLSILPWGQSKTGWSEVPLR
jgi:hypothetical protein